jgi:hypothetical protein
MWNPFKKHEEEHEDITWLLSQLTFALNDLQENVKDLREEVNYLSDFLDD